MSFDAESPAYVLVRWTLYLGVLLAVGAISFALAVVPLLERKGRDPAFADAAAARAAAIGFHATMLVIIATLFRLAAQLYAFYDPNEGPDVDLIRSMVMQTVWGWGWLLQFVSALVTTCGLHFVKARLHDGTPGAKIPWFFACGGAVGLALSCALSGHAAAVAQYAPLAVLADTLHVLGAGAWLGGLAVLTNVAFRVRPAAPAEAAAESPSRSSALLMSFTPVALIAASTVAVTGAFATWLHVHDFSQLVSTPYGIRLSAKLIAVASVAALGALNWRWFTPRESRTNGARNLRIAAALEMGLGALALLATAILVATAPPDDLVSGE